MGMRCSPIMLCLLICIFVQPMHRYICLFTRSFAAVSVCRLGSLSVGFALLLLFSKAFCTHFHVGQEETQEFWRFFLRKWHRNLKQQSLKFCSESVRIFVSLYLQNGVCFSLIRFVIALKCFHFGQIMSVFFMCFAFSGTFLSLWFMCGFGFGHVRMDSIHLCI